MRLAEIAPRIGAHVLRDAAFDSLGLLSYRSTRMLVCLYDPAFLQRELIPNPNIAAVVTTPELASRIPDPLGLAVASDPVSAFYAIHQLLLRETEFYGRDFPTEIGDSAIIHPSAYVAPRNVVIGAGALIEPHASVLPNSIIGPDCVIRAGAVIGAEGFEPKRFGDSLRVIPHAGGVRLGQCVEIQSNSVVCRSVFNTVTAIGDHTKIATLVNISHNVTIGRRCRIASSASLMGSSRIGDDVWIGPNATVSNQIVVGDNAEVSLGAVVIRDVPPGTRVTGNLAIDHRRFLTHYRSLLK